MTTVFNDNLQVSLTIDGLEWHVKEAKVELSRMDTPNYVDLIMVPDPNDTVPELPSPITNLLGADFRLEADTDLITNRDTNAEEDSLLFAGQLANISPTGEKTYEGIAYDPAQQAFAPESDGGSIMNEYIYLGLPEYSYGGYMWGGYGLGGTRYEIQTIEASELVERCMDALNIDDFDIELADGGVTVEGENGSYTGGYERTMYFSESFIKVSDALDRARESTESEWWFDKEGVFHFGVPRPTKHALQFITDSSAGKTTPPYQSIRLIGSGAASQEGYSRATMNIEDKIVLERNIAETEGGEITVVEPDEDEDPKSPTFEYRNLEVSNDEQAESVVQKVAEDLAEQQADGKVTVVGFPEVLPLDGILMPQSVNPDAENYNEKQPMGGRAYNVYKVVHKLNSSDGFVTDIHVAGVVGVTRTVVSPTDTSGPSSQRELTTRERRLLNGTADLE